jgi:hypothetical protein
MAREWRWLESWARVVSMEAYVSRETMSEMQGEGMRTRWANDDVRRLRQRSSTSLSLCPEWRQCRAWCKGLVWLPWCVEMIGRKEEAGWSSSGSLMERFLTDTNVDRGNTEEWVFEWLFSLLWRGLGQERTFPMGSIRESSRWIYRLKSVNVRCLLPI